MHVKCTSGSKKPPKSVVYSISGWSRAFINVKIGFRDVINPQIGLATFLHNRGLMPL